MLPRTWNDQMLILAGLLIIQFIFFTLVIQWNSPVFESPIINRYTHPAQISWTDLHPGEDDLTLMDRIRWNLDTWTHHSPIITEDGLATISPRLPLIRRSWLIKYHLHSKQPYQFKWLEHIPSTYPQPRQYIRHLDHLTMHDLSTSTISPSSSVPTPTPPTSTPTQSSTPSTTASTPLSTPSPSSPPPPPPPPPVKKVATAEDIDHYLNSLATSLDTNNQCDNLMGTGLVAKWDRTKETFCVNPNLPAPSHELLDDKLLNLLEDVERGNNVDVNQDPPAAIMKCRSMTIEHMPPPTAPHSFCTATNLFIDLSTFSPASAPKFRAGYVMGHMNHYHFGGGTFSGACTRTAQFSTGLISADHQRDIVDAYSPINAHQRTVWKEFLTQLNEGKAPLAKSILSKEGAPAPTSSNSLMVIPNTILLITRENGEHVNLYHTMTDFWNAYLMMHLFNLPRTGVRVLFLDNHGPSPFDVAWQQVFSGGGPVMKAQDLVGSKGNILASSAIMVPPGYSSPLYRYLYEDDGECRKRTNLFPRFASFFLAGFGVRFRRWQFDSTLKSLVELSEEDQAKAVRTESFTTNLVPTKREAPMLHLVLVSRRPYNHFVDHKRINRQIFNEATLMDFLKSDSKYENIRLDIVDLARIGLKQQLLLMASTDILIGMHGAALSHTMFLPPWSALLELHPIGQKWQCFKHQTEWSGLAYFAWRNSRPGAEREDSTGSGVDVDPASFQVVLDEAIRAARERRLAIEEGISQL